MELPVFTTCGGLYTRIRGVEKHRVVVPAFGDEVDAARHHSVRWNCVSPSSHFENGSERVLGLL